MKSFVSVLLALLLGVSISFAQAPAGNQPKPVAPPAAAPAAGKESAVTSINNAGVGAQRPAAKAGQKQETAAEAPKNVFDLLKSGGWAMYLLAAMSFLAVMFVLVFMLTLRRSAILTSHYMNTADVLLKKRDYLGLLAISSRHGECVARVVQRTLDFATKNPSAGIEVVREVATSEASAQASSLQHRVTYLADIGTLSPMVGLLGTVFGMIRAFGELSKGAQNRDWGLAGGVSEALVATAAGLVVGLFAFAFYAYFRNKVQRLISDLEVASAHILGLIALNYNKKREPSRAAMDDEF